MATTSKQEIILTTCPKDCYDSCGIAVIKENGAITRVRGDLNNPINRGALCGKCAVGYNGVIRDPKARLNTPLKRVGAKGEGKFEPISWDEAIDTIASRLKGIVADKGPEGIVYAHYTGTMSKIGYSFPTRFFNRLGAVEVEPDTVCNMAANVSLDYTLGTAQVGFDPRTVKDANCVVVWGGNPSHSGPHMHKHWFQEAPGTKIVIDPVRHATAEKADLHLQLRPGTDGALAFAMLHVLRRENLIDRKFVGSHVLGWDEIEPMLDACTPEWGESITDVPAAQIEEAARIYGSGPSLLLMGQGLQRTYFGGNAYRACVALAAATGNYGKPGAGTLFINTDGKIRGMDGDYVTAPQLRRTPRKAVSHMDVAGLLESPDNYDAFLCYNINPVASNPEQTRLRRALTRDNLFTVVVELFQTDTADYADIVLPAAGFLEYDDLVTGYFNLTVGPQSKAMEPIGESLPNQEIFRRLARAMGYEEPELYEDDRSIIDYLLKDTSFNGTFEDLQKMGTHFVTDEPVIQFPDLKFPTPSGKIELYSEQAEKDGFPRVPQPLYDERSKQGYVRLITPASDWLMNDTFGNDPRIIQELGAATVAVNPRDAKRLGLREGDDAKLSNETGELVLKVKVSEQVRPGVVLSHKGRWLKNERGRANVNVLNPGHKSDMGESSAVHGIEVAIAPMR
ncbi:MAG: molybdopterin-dependent oxidoreductase [Chloroflexi bacterium]|nr:molybdopterin-dependent oxidoreductase [Chloroflexota bacterium]